MAPITAINAARRLAAELALPAARGSVFAWAGDGQERIVVRADRQWLRNHRVLPPSFMGFPVTADDPGDVIAYR